MFTRDKVHRSIKSLPNSFSIDELIDHSILMEEVEEGYRQSEEGKLVSNEDLKTILDKRSK